MQPLVSVILTTHNRARLVGRAIESILNQTYKNFELLIIDDCSQDNTQEILSQYAAKDARVCIIKNEQNIGITKSINRGLSYAKGKYVFRLDDDDIVKSQTIELEEKFLEDHPSYGLVGSFAIQIDAQGNEIGKKTYPTGSKELRAALMKENAIYSAILMRKEAIDRVGRYNEKWKYAQDYELYLKIVKYYEVANLPNYLVYYYKSATDSISRTKSKAQTMFALQARFKAIRQGIYPAIGYIFLLRDYTQYLVFSFTPSWFRRWLEKFL